jgi:phosphopantothenoylcysteine decarboxylase/phosphopantothenate--cysteine ligase
MKLKGKNVLVGISGGIAAYKVCDLIRLLQKDDFNVDVIMTEHAKEFITPLTVQTLTGNPVYSDLFTLIQESKIGHISLADKADIIVIVPATANVIGKIAGGIADDLLTTTVMASSAPVLLVPSMNTKMWENPIVRENVQKIAKYYQIMQPAEGLLACGVYGSGKLPGVEDIFEAIRIVLNPKPLKGKKILITAGPTIEELDPVRYISNYSSGKMGYALAQVARRLGGEVVLVTGPSSLRLPYDVKTINIKSADEMMKACVKEIKNTDILVMCAAVADFRPESKEIHKIKKSEKEMTLSLLKNPDILQELSKYKKKGAIFVGFSAETKELQANARKKLTAKKLDLIVANNILEKGAGFGSDTNKVTLITQKSVQPLLLMSKEDVAHEIFTCCVNVLGQFR